MAYKNSSASEYNLDSIHIYAKVGRKIVYSAEQDQQGHWHGTRTEYYVPPVINLPYFGTIWYDKAGDMTNYGFYTFTIDWVTFETIRPFLSYGNTLNITLSSRGNENYRELISFNGSGSKYDADWRTKLHCDCPKSTLKVDYVDQQAYTLYLNGQKFTHPIAYPDGINMNTYRMYFASLMGSNSFVKSTTQLNYNCGNKTIFYPLEFKATCGSWQIPETIEVSQSNASGEYFYGKATEHSIYIKSTMSPISGYAGQRYDDIPMSFRYYIDDWNLPNSDILEFTSDEMENGETWVGNVSPEFTYLTSQNTGLSLGGDPQMGWSDESYTENEYYQGKQGDQYVYKLSDQKDLPTTIGNVTCINPELINDYTQDATNTSGDEEEEPEQVRNTIFKIKPKLNCEARPLLRFTNPTINNTNEVWGCVNCYVNNDNEIVVTGENPYVYQEYYRPKYASENDPNNILNNTEYRQRHFTHYRYLDSSFIYRDINEIVPEGEEPHWYNYRPDIKLICKPYGDIQGHTWTAKFDTTTQLYDLLKCNANAISSLDEYSHTAQPEWLELRDDTAETGSLYDGITYIAEKPMTEFGYLPNIVGRIEIPIDTTENHRIKLGNLLSVYKADITYKETVANVNWVTNFTENEFEITYNEGYDNIDIRVDKGKVYFNEQVSDTIFSIITEDGEYPVLTSSSWQHYENNNFDISYCILRLKCKLNNISYNIDYKISFATANTIINYKLYEDENGNAIGIDFRYYSIDDDDTAEYYYNANNVLMVKVWYDAGMNIDFGSEFQEPIEFGQKSPVKRDDTTHSPHQFYHNRYLNICINGARSLEIPEITKEKWVNSQSGEEMELWTIVKTSHLKTDSNNKGNRWLYFRDDLGEISFNLSDYTADSDGHYDIDAITKGEFGWVNWLYKNYEIKQGPNRKYRFYNLFIRPRVDYIQADNNNLARFINNNNHNLVCVADYGASVQGIDQQDNNSGNIIDNSPYLNSGGIAFRGKSYFDEKHGTDTTINLNTKTRYIAKVIDGGKYHFSIVKVLGYIWRNINGLILRDNQGKIEQGGGRQ